MHRFRSKSTIVRFRITAFLLCLKYFLPMATLFVLGWSILTNDRELTHVAFALAGLTLLCATFRCLLARRALCPLCMMPVLAKKLCAKHRNARKLLGSHRLRVAVSVLRKGYFTCPFCHEASVMEVRQRHGRGVNYSRH